MPLRRTNKQQLLTRQTRALSQAPKAPTTKQKYNTYLEAEAQKRKRTKKRCRLLPIAEYQEVNEEVNVNVEVNINVAALVSQYNDDGYNNSTLFVSSGLLSIIDNIDMPSEDSFEHYTTREPDKDKVLLNISVGTPSQQRRKQQKEDSKARVSIKAGNDTGIADNVGQRDIAS